MAREKLSRREHRALHRALEPVFRTSFPNPERKDCPGTAKLRAIARKKLPIQDPAIDHVGSCSPCFSELQDIRKDIRRKRVLWVAAVITASIIIVVVALGYGPPRTPASDGTVHTKIERTAQAAALDLRNFSVVRGISPFPAPHLDTLQLNRSLLDLTIQLPIGTEEGPYEVEIRKDGQSPLTTAKGTARIEDHITTLRVQIDTSHIPPGDYRLAVRHADFDWRYYSVTLR